MINIIKKIQRKVKAKTMAYGYRGIIKRNTVLKNIKSGGRCFIIGNGPSLNTQDLTRLAKEETFVVNTFWNHPQYKEMDPKYYLIMDRDVFPTINQDSNFFSNEILQKHELLGSRPTKFFFHALGKEFVEKNALFKNKGVYYLMSHGTIDDKLRFNTDISKIIPHTKNVVVAAIIIAVYMGFEKIYLLGCEHDFLAYPSNKHYEGFKHFYKTNYSGTNIEDVKNYKLATGSYEQHMFNVLTLFKNYRLLKEKISRTHPKVKIFNATPNSFLDVFPFVKYENLVS